MAAAKGWYGRDGAPVLAIPTLELRNQGQRIAEVARVWCGPSPPMVNAGVSMVQMIVENGAGGTPRVVARSTTPPPNSRSFRWKDRGCGPLLDIELPAGAYAIVACVGEPFLRAMHTEPVPFGQAGGHPTLASQHPVVFAGEIRLGDGMRVVGWSSCSGTYQLPMRYVRQALPYGLPLELFYGVVKASACGCSTIDASVMSRGTRLDISSLIVRGVYVGVPSRASAGSPCFPMWTRARPRHGARGGAGLSNVPLASVERASSAGLAGK